MTDSPMARYKRYTNALEIIHGLISQLLLRCDYHGSGQSNEQMAVTLAGGSCLVSVAKLPRTRVEAHLVKSKVIHDFTGFCHYYISSFLIRVIGFVSS